MNILIVEDDSKQQQALAIFIKEYDPACRVFCACDYTEALDTLTENTIALFLLDIELQPECTTTCQDGLALAKQIRSLPQYARTPIVFLTSIPERIFEALNETHCFDYLLKPYDRQTLYRCLDQIVFPLKAPDTYLTFCDAQGIRIRLKSKEVLYLSSAGHQIHVHTADCIYTTATATLDSFAQKLALPFLRCHRKYIVNLEHARHYDKTNRFVTVGNESIPVGRSYKTEFEERYTEP